MPFINCAEATLEAYSPTSAKPWNQQRALHLSRRIICGANQDRISEMLSRPPGEVVDEIVEAAYTEVVYPEPPWGYWTVEDYDPDPEVADGQVYEQVVEIAMVWLRQLQSGSMRDRMSWFWHNHFVTRFDDYRCPGYLYQYFHLLQKYALGNFKDFVYEIGKTPAMLIFLNGVESTRFEPNENYARELYELFTMGLDNGYTQTDISETARALTGWNNLQVLCGPIEFYPPYWDSGTKTIFGQTGNWGYDEVIDILFDQKATEISEFVCGKLYRYFVNPKEDEEIILEMAATFRDNNFEIKPVLQQLFKSEHFFDSAHFETVIPGHIEFFLTMMNELDLAVNDEVLFEIALFGTQNNQRIFNPVDVAGWPGNRLWINTNSINARWTAGHQILSNQYFNVDPEVFRTFALNLADNNINDVYYIARRIIDYILPNGLQHPADYERMTTYFKGEIPDNYFEDGTWNLYWDEVPLQVALLVYYLTLFPGIPTQIIMGNHHQHRGISLQDQEAHQQDHQNWSRRSFLKSLGIIGGSSIALGGFSLQTLANSALPLALANGPEDRILVLIRLKGGNDGLNTIIPLYDYGTYQAYRPNIAVNQANILNLNPAFGIPNTLSGLMPFWNEGQMKVINTVGYSDQNLSHFRSSDIWASASDADVVEKSGWLGRYILDDNPDVLNNPPAIPSAIKIGGAGSIVFNDSNQIDLSVNFILPEDLAQYAETGELYDTDNLPNDCYYGEQVGFVRNITNSTLAYSEAMGEAYNSGTNAVNYSNNILSRQLAVIARLIKGDLGTKLYMVTLDGFDTHAGQNNTHPLLLSYLAAGVSEFYADLAADNRDQEVLSMTFSEFGRRVQQNGSLGTDHGTAAPLLLFGPGLNGSDILGADPNLNSLDPYGNLRHSVDFRSVYATVLESWLCIDPVSVDSILGDSFERIENIGLECGTTTGVAEVTLKQGIRHRIRPDGFGGMVIEYELARPGNIDLSVFTVLGQKVRTLHHGYQLAGAHEATFASPHFGLASQLLFYRISDGQRQYTGKFMMN